MVRGETVIRGNVPNPKFFFYGISGRIRTFYWKKPIFTKKKNP
jgi:hypothetical protein